LSSQHATERAEAVGALSERAIMAGAAAAMQKAFDGRTLAFNVTQATRWVDR